MKMIKNSITRVAESVQRLEVIQSHAPRELRRRSPTFNRQNFHISNSANLTFPQEYESDRENVVPFYHPNNTGGQGIVKQKHAGSQGSAPKKVRQAET